MTLFNFSIKGESFQPGKLEVKTRKFDLELHTKAQSISHTLFSVAFFYRIDEFAAALNNSLYAAAATEHIAIHWLSITIFGNIEKAYVINGKKKNKGFQYIDVVVEIMSDAEDRLLSGILKKARQSAQISKNINTHFNYSISSVIHLN